MSLASEFKEFAMKGNVIDLAVGVIIGAAFGKIVSSLVGDMFMPTLGKLIGGVNFSDLAVSLGKDPTGKEVLISYGSFVQTIFDFLIIALVLFITIKGINRLKKPPATEGPAAGAAQVRGASGRDTRSPREARLKSRIWVDRARCLPDSRAMARD